MRSFQLLFLALLATAASADVQYTFTGLPLTMFSGSCPLPCIITGSFTAADFVKTDFGLMVDITPEIKTFGFGLNGDNDLFTPANSTIHAEVDTIDGMPGTGAPYDCFPVFCIWSVTVGGTSGFLRLAGADTGGIGQGATDEVDLPDLSASSNAQYGGFWSFSGVLSPIPEPRTLILLATVALTLGWRRFKAHVKVT